MAGNVHAGHRARLKERFLNESLDAFNSHQILELLLYYGVPYRDTNGVAHNLISKYGSLSAVFEANYEELMQMKDIGSNSAVLLKLIPELSKKYLADKWRDRPQLGSTTLAGEYAVTLFVGVSYEVFYLICLDAQHRVNMAVPVFEGTINEAPVYPRLIVENALRYKASSVILSHNHPGGSVNASKADIEATMKLKLALSSISVNVVDHIIVAGNDYVSLAEKGLIQF